EVFDGFRDFIASVRQQPVEAHADAQTARDPVEYGGRNDRRPTPEKESHQCADMKKDHKDIIAPIDAGVAPGWYHFPLHFVSHFETSHHHVLIAKAQTR